MSTLNKWMKKVANLFKEKPQVKVDDYELEHLLIYHSLVGTSPENQRSFKDVKGDIELALGNESSAQMAIALRLPPLWWDEKLKAILSELGEREKFITCLAPDVPDDSFDMSAIPLLHEDWRVRANTAILLGFLQAENVEAKLIQSLHDTATGARTAFPHQAYALAKFRSAQTQAALEKYLMDDDSWMRVDAAGALALMNEGKLSETQLKSILEKHSLSDYGAVVIARNLDLPAIMASSNRLESTAGARLIDGILESSSGTFPAETVTETRTSECLPQLFKLVRDDKCITAANASFTLAQWLDANHSYTLLAPPPSGLVEDVLIYLASEEFHIQLIEQLKTLKASNWETDALLKTELRSAIELAGKLRIKEAAPLLLPLVAAENPWLSESIASLGLIGDSLSASEKENAANRLIALAKSTVDLEERFNRQPQAHPVFEENESAATNYWRILIALRAIAAPESLQFLTEATKDFAPDKRVEALRSLVKVASALFSQGASRDKFQNQVSESVSRSLNDPSVEVRKAALIGVNELDLADEIKRVVKLASAKELSVVKEAFNTLSELAKKGHKESVLKALDQGLKMEADIHKRQNLKKFIETLGRNAPDSTS